MGNANPDKLATMDYMNIIKFFEDQLVRNSDSYPGYFHFRFIEPLRYMGLFSKQITEAIKEVPAYAFGSRKY